MNPMSLLKDMLAITVLAWLVLGLLVAAPTKLIRQSTAACAHHQGVAQIVSVDLFNFQRAFVCRDGSVR